MKTTLFALLTLIVTTPTWATPPIPPGNDLSQSTLSTSVYYVDSIFADALGSLELIASTPAAQSGDWKRIKPYLEQAEARLPGVYFYVLPDGNYYSLALDYTNLNLRDRPYFNPLFAGKPVMGFPIYSRSSGKRSALVAAPIIVDHKVTGALGISIFLDDLNSRLNQIFDLPKNYTWFVLNREGDTMLDKESDYIFMNALTQGGQSLRAAVSRALQGEQGEQGEVQYQMTGTRYARYQKLPHMDWWMFLARVEGTKAEPAPKLELSLDRFVPELQQRLDSIDSSLTTEIKCSAPDTSNESQIRMLLTTLLVDNPDVVEAAFVDRNGILRYIEPSDYRNFENSDISNQAHIIAMRNNPMPQFTGGFMTAEHFQAVVLAHPLFDQQHHFAGQINLLIRPELLINPLLKKSQIPADYDLWIMQTDGLIIYDQDKPEIGKMLFSDPGYAKFTSLLELGRKIASSPSGEGSYIYLAPDSSKKVIKNAVWKTVRLHHQEWRVVLAYRPYEKN